MQGVVLAEEFARAKAPLRADFFGDTLVGPTILQWGTEEQKKEFLPQDPQRQMRWCQGFSEPNSGSDLASLKTTAVLDGDEWVINGQKVWTTGGHHADYCFLLTRTDPDAPKHKGISYLLVPMRQPGVEVRGITQPDGTAEFCEVFFDDARCPKDNVVGGVNNGWKVANSTLGVRARAERDHRVPPLRGGVRPDGRRGRGQPASIDDPVIRQRLARYYTKIQILRINGLRSLSATLTGSKDPSVAALGAMNKMYWSRDAQGGDGARPRHVRRPVDARRQRSGARLVARRRSATSAATGYPVSPMMSAVLLQSRSRRSGAAPARSSATSSASASSASPRNRVER